MENKFKYGDYIIITENDQQGIICDLVVRKTLVLPEDVSESSLLNLEDVSLYEVDEYWYDVLTQGGTRHLHENDLAIDI